MMRAQNGVLTWVNWSTFHKISIYISWYYCCFHNDWEFDIAQYKLQILNFINNNQATTNYHEFLILCLLWPHSHCLHKKNAYRYTSQLRIQVWHQMNCSGVRYLYTFVRSDSKQTWRKEDLQMQSGSCKHIIEEIKLFCPLRWTKLTSSQPAKFVPDLKNTKWKSRNIASRCLISQPN